MKLKICPICKKKVVEKNSWIVWFKKKTFHSKCFHNNLNKEVENND